jgi:nitrogen fixation/metabolism regulation signal transduction histidine kinase
MFHAIHKSLASRLSRLFRSPEQTAVEVLNRENSKEQNSDILPQVAIMIAHDIKNPLTTMQIEISRMKTEYASHKRLIRDLEYLERQRRKIDDIAQIASLVRIREEFFHRRFKKTRINELLQRVIKDVKSGLNDQKIHFRVSAYEVVALVEPDLLKRTLESSIRNFVDAMDASDRQSGVISIDLIRRSQSESEPLVGIQITDTERDLGMKSNVELKDLFSAPGIRDVVGLMWVEKGVSLHNGSAQITRTPSNLGTTLTILLPRG